MKVILALAWRPGQTHVPFEVLNFCMLEQVWSRWEDMVTVTFELLEACRGHIGLVQWNLIYIHTRI